MANTKVTDLYIEYASGITDAPRIYSQWLSYLVLSSVVCKNLFMRYGIGNLYPNFYFLIVGPSSVFRKSFSQKIAISIIREIMPEFPLMDVSSREAFISELARDDRTPFGSGMIVIDEMAGFMSRVKNSHHFNGMIQDLSSAFTADTIERRTGVAEETKKIYKISEPFLNMTAACSFDWLTKSIETSDLTGGFLARFLWIVATEKKGEHWSEARPADKLLKGRIIDRLNDIRQLVGEMSWNPKAKKMWDEWYSDFRTRHQGGKWDANYERMTNQVRKIAMLNAAQDLRKEITDEDLDSAIAMTEPLVECLTDIVIGESKEEVIRNKIYSFIRRKAPHPVNRSNLLNYITGIDAWTLNGHIQTLIEMEKIEIVLDDSEGKAGRKPTLYKIK